MKSFIAPGHSVASRTERVTLLLFASFFCIGFIGGCHKLPPTPEVPNPAADALTLSAEQIARSHIEIAKVSRQSVAAPVLTSGRIAFDEARVGHVLPPVTGRVVKILASLGAHVEKGEPLAEISSPDLGQAVADASRAHADLLAAERDFERQRTLYEGHAAAQKDFEAAHNRFLQAQAEYARADKKSRLLGGNENAVTDTYILRAPLAGDIVARNINPGIEVQGQYDGGSTVTELFTIGSLESVWALADVFEMDLARIDLHDRAQISVVAYPDETFECRVDYIAAAIDPATRSAQVRCRLNNANRKLKPEMFVTFRVLSDRGDGLSVPRSALLRQGNRTFVWVVQGDAGSKGERRFLRRLVAAQEDAFGESVPVIAGLKEGEEIVSHGGVLMLGT